MAYKKTQGPGRFEGRTVQVNGNFDRALKTFTKKIQNSGILNDIRAKEYYEKPAEKKQRVMKASVKNEHRRISEDKKRPKRV